MISVQRKVQGALLPGHWVPPLTRRHGETHEWTFTCGKADAIASVWAAATATDGYVPVRKTEDSVTIDFLTKAKWLDRIQLTFSDAGDGSCTCKAFNASTGLLPLVVPLAPVLNALLFFVPFRDWGKCGATLNKLRRATEERADLLSNFTIASRVVEYSLGNPSRGKDAAQ